MQVTVVGTGYVGIVTAVGLAILGHRVHCVDIDHKRIQALSKGISPIYEEGIKENLKMLLAKQLITFDNNHRSGDAVFFLTVGTPALSNGDTDLSNIFSALDQIIKIAPKRALYIIKSTVPIGTNAKITTYLKQKLPYCCYVASNPEFLREGNALNDFLHPDRIIIGVEHPYATAILTQLYQPLINHPSVFFLITDPSTAELAKHASNAFLATKLTLVNELADLCEKAKANIDDLTLAIGLDKRIGKDYLQIGPGFGGSCLPKDIQSLNMRFHHTYGIASNILTAVIAANTNRFKNIATKITTILGGLQNKILAIYGLTFKANTDDTRESPAIKIIEWLAMQQPIIQCYDPKAQYDSVRIPNQYRAYIQFYNTPEEAIHGAEALIIATEWEVFKYLDFDQIKRQMKCPIVIDLRNLLNEQLMRKKGFTYYCLGKAMP